MSLVAFEAANVQDMTERIWVSANLATGKFLRFEIEEILNFKTCKHQWLCQITTGEGND